jgi:hypothetical protein
MEIITYVRTGAITHKDSLGNEGRTAAGDVQVMSAGSGIRHAEFNQENEPTTLFQIWIMPNRTGGPPSWGAKPFPKGDRSGAWQILASGFDEDGDALPIRTDARVLAATNRDLEAEITAGKFREDLFYRLNVIEIHIPPLRERPEDIVPLATHFIGLFSRQKPRFSATVVNGLTRYRWPGNVRELKNAMERAALLSRGEIVLPEHLPARILSASAEPAPGDTVEASRLAEIERDAILKSLRKNNYNRTETARELAISRRALTYKLLHMREQGLPVDPPSAE